MIEDLVVINNKNEKEKGGNPKPSLTITTRRSCNV